jgi:hypothetical protein
LANSPFSIDEQETDNLQNWILVLLQGSGGAANRVEWSAAVTGAAASAGP